MSAMTTTSRYRIPLHTVAARAGWFATWAFFTTFAWFEVVKHGWIRGDSLDAIVLTTAAVVAFILPDLTFLVEAGRAVQKGYLPRQAVPFYNAMHRLWPPLLVTSVVGVAFAPLNSVGLAAFVVGLSWMAHVTLDRAAGYGLRNADGSR